jgi:superfamily II DNA or RNA helicase
MSNTDIIYNLEIDSLSPRCSQPEKIKQNLKPHQLACLYKAIHMENVGSINYKIKKNNDTYDNIKISTNIGIIGDIVGYGKTLTALSIIAQNPLNNIHINNIMVNSYHSNKAYNYFTAVSSNKKTPNIQEMISSTLIIVPRGPVYVQWEKTLKNNTSLKYIAIDSLTYIKKNLPEYNLNNEREIIDYFNQYDAVLIKNTTLSRFLDYYNNSYKDKFINRWKRIIIDECHDIINKIEIFNYLFIWLISGTYMNVCDRYSSTSYSQYYNIKDILKEEYIDYLLVKCNKNFVRESFKIPAMIENYYLCKMSKYLKAIKNYINQSVLEKINANDISGAVKELGGKNNTEEGIAKLICADMNKSIYNKQKEREFVLGLDISEEQKANKIKNIDTELKILEDKLKDLTERITEIKHKTCSICLDNIKDPILLDCTHIFCGSCLMHYLNNSNVIYKRCPECRCEIKSTENLTAIISEKEVENEIIEVNKYNMIGKGILNKEETLLEIIKNNKKGKFIVFSRVDSFAKIIEELNNNNITYASLKGHTSHMMNVLNNFKSGEVKVILLTTQYAGSGIDISCATDVIILHSMDIDKQQAIGRAQRVGREDSLYVHNLCYDHELPSL